MEWHGYPQHEDAHETRPWWIYTGHLPKFNEYIRIDGKKIRQKSAHYLTAAAWAGENGWVMIDSFGITEDKALAAFDEQFPLPIPKPIVSQVWVWPDIDGALELTLTGIDKSTTPVTLYWAGGPTVPSKSWPPKDAVLVAGPCSPWAPPVK